MDSPCSQQGKNEVREYQEPEQRTPLIDLSAALPRPHLELRSRRPHVGIILDNQSQTINSSA